MFFVLTIAWELELFLIHSAQIGGRVQLFPERNDYLLMSYIILVLEVSLPPPMSLFLSCSFFFFSGFVALVECCIASIVFYVMIFFFFLHKGKHLD